MIYTWASRTDVGRVREHNEDALLPEPGTSGTGPRLVAAVADGMGGAVGGEIASSTTIATIAAVSGDAAMRIQAANIAVIDAASQRPRLKGMGTTATVALLEEDGTLEVGHVGDSRAYLLRGGVLTQITADHSFVGEMISSGRLTEAEAENHPYRSVLTRVVGLEPDVEVEVHHIGLTAGDRLLLCSDGISSMIDDTAVAGALRESDPAAAAERLIAAANAAGGQDNISVIVVDVG